MFICRPTCKKTYYLFRGAKMISLLVYGREQIMIIIGLYAYGAFLASHKYLFRVLL